MIENSKQAEFVLLQKLASHFKISRSRIKKENIKDTPIISYTSDVDEIYIPTDLFYCISLNKINLLELFEFEKFKRGVIFESFHNGISYLPDNKTGSYKLAVYLTGMIWLVYTGRSYVGEGGIFIFDKDNNEGYVIEPLKNYLQFNF